MCNAIRLPALLSCFAVIIITSSSDFLHIRNDKICSEGIEREEEKEHTGGWEYGNDTNNNSVVRQTRNVRGKVGIEGSGENAVKSESRDDEHGVYRRVDIYK